MGGSGTDGTDGDKERMKKEDFTERAGQGRPAFGEVSLFFFFLRLSNF